MRDYKTCNHYKPGDCINFNPSYGCTDCGDCEDYERRTADVYREAETVPVVTEQAEPAIKVGLDKLTTIADSEFEKALEKGAVKMVYETEHDAVNHPNHYTQGGIECIDALKAATVNLKGIEAVCTANAIKYLWRWKEKNGTEDLKKSLWYINRLIQEVSNNG